MYVAKYKNDLWQYVESLLVYIWITWSIINYDDKYLESSAKYKTISSSFSSLQTGELKK